MKLVVSRIILTLLAICFAFPGFTQSVREERRLIMAGNKLYVERKFKEAASKYKEAMGVNQASAVAMYNLGMANIRQVVNPKDSSDASATLLNNGVKLLNDVAKMAKEKPGLASKANYNLGNLEFNRENYAEAISHYKQSLRIDPKDANAKKNLRIAQLKLKQQEQDKNKDQNKEQDNNKDKDQNKDQNKDKDKDQNKDQNKDENKDNDKDKQDGKIDRQTASQILQAIDNKESQTRARVNRANKGEKSEAAARRIKKW